MWGTGSKRAIPTPESIWPKTARPLRSGQIPNAIPFGMESSFTQKKIVVARFGFAANLKEPI
jgi:hypothetical protein